MASPLTLGASYRQLVPGDPDELEQLVARLASLAQGMVKAAGRLRGIEAGKWQGEAADAFRQLLGEQPAKYEQAGRAFAQASQALAGYAVVLREAQAQAQGAVARFEQAEHETRLWRGQWDAYNAEVRAAQTAAAMAGVPPAQPIPPRVGDPGQTQRTSAYRLLGEARGRVRGQARAAAAALAAAEQEAPKKPGLLASLAEGVGDFLGGFFKDGAGGVIAAAWESIGAFLDDPGGWVKDTWDNFYDHVAVWNWDTFSKTWIAFGKDFVAWDEWAKNPWRALGQVTFNMAFTVGTALAGKAIVRLLKRRKLPTPSPGKREHHLPHSKSPAENRNYYERPPGTPPYEKSHLTQGSKRHVLEGEGYGNGGHRPRTGYPRKTEFPDGWSDQQILDTVEQAAQNPVRHMEEKRTPKSAKHPQGQERYIYRGEANGLQLEIVLNKQGRVVTARPLRGQPGTFTDPHLPPGLDPRLRPLYTRPDPKRGNPGYWTYQRPDGTLAHVHETTGQHIPRPRDAPLTPVPPPREEDGGAP